MDQAAQFAPAGKGVHYERRRPEDTVLYQLVQEHLETFLAQAEAETGSGLPDFVKAEFDAFLECGILAHGFLRLRCADCAHEKLVAFSCKKRGFCPSCGARRMAETAAHLVDHLIPRVPVRQWVISFPIPLPMMPGMSMAGMMDDSDLPPGWTYSPSTYLQRLPIVALGAVGLLISRHLAGYQLGHIDAAWDPFFPAGGGLNGTETIITSEVSKAWPIADAGLGAVTYLFEILMGVMGDRRRWRTMPWMVAMFGVVVVPLGVVSIYFIIIIQPIVIGTWCSLCLLAALAMLVMIPYSLDELVAMGQYLVQDHYRGGAFWRTFFQGGAQPDGGRDDTPGFDAPLASAYASAARGITDQVVAAGQRAAGGNVDVHPAAVRYPSAAGPTATTWSVR